ncbi:MAG: helix-turn-helix domain-containing protein [Mariprofundus sp.]|nr:helix-turn-helix domain-containing protein [Mariprofundus sp.]
MKRSSDEPDLLEFMIHPPNGWLRHKRDKLGITGSQLAAKIGVSKQRISALEKAERTGAASLKSMRQAAAALGCDFVYALLPKGSLQTSHRASELQVFDPLECIQSSQGMRQLTQLCLAFHIKNLGLYGSAARDQLHANSDINLLAEFQQPDRSPDMKQIEELELQFGRLFGRKTTLAKQAILDDPQQADHIMADLKLIYAS